MSLMGPFNSYGYDAGLKNQFDLADDSTWSVNYIDEWTPSGSPVQINVWGMNPDGKPDATLVLGDVDGDSVLDRLPPSSLSDLSVNITQEPPRPHLAWKIRISEGSMRFALIPVGNMWIQLAIYILMWVLPVLGGILAVWLYVQSFYKVKFNKAGAAVRQSRVSKLLQRIPAFFGFEPIAKEQEQFIEKHGTVISSAPRRRVLIATMEYNIDDWKIKVKIGGLGG